MEKIVKGKYEEETAITIDWGVMTMSKKELQQEQKEEPLKILQDRFANNMNRREGIAWEKVRARLLENPGKLQSLHEMEKTGGEPDVVGYDEERDEYVICDCSKESPKGRRSVCYDREAQEKGRNKKPETSAMVMAQEMGIEILMEEQYRTLQQLDEFDLKTSSWIKTPADIRKQGGAR